MEFYLKTDVKICDQFIPADLVDWEKEADVVTTVRFEKDILCDILLAYLRAHCIDGYFEPGKDRSKVILTRPKHLAYEQHVFNNYLKLLEYLETTLSLVNTLEQDLELLSRRGDEAISYELRQVVLYRAEKKNILRSQIIMVKLCLQVLDGAENSLKKTKGMTNIELYRNFTNLVLLETPEETARKNLVVHDNSMTVQEKAARKAKLEWAYYHRRFINGTYFKHLKQIIVAKDFM